LPIVDKAGNKAGVIGIARAIPATIKTQGNPTELVSLLCHIERHLAAPCTPAVLATLAAMPHRPFTRMLKRLFRSVLLGF